LREKDDEVNNIRLELGDRVESVESAEILSLRQGCVDYFKRIYTHVAAYHACRPTNIESYLSKGIIPANMEVSIEKAKIFFGDPEAVAKAVEDIGISYLNHGRDKIGFFMSRTGSLESGYSHYLEYGSELFKSMATRLGEWAVQKVSNQGSPTLFRCALPLSWLDNLTTFPMAHGYALEPLILLLEDPRWREDRGGTITGAFLLKHSLPKEYILDTIDMTPFMEKKEA
jgi:hypothetical protein